MLASGVSMRGEMRMPERRPEANKKKTGSLASEFQFQRGCLHFIHQTRMYCALSKPENRWQYNPWYYGERIGEATNMNLRVAPRTTIQKIGLLQILQRKSTIGNMNTLPPRGMPYAQQVLGAQQI
jgi:hypothetical protein